MATPHVAGILAVLFTNGHAPDLVETALYKGASDTNIDILREGHGVADALASWTLLVGEQTPEAPSEPRISLYRLDDHRGDLLKQDWTLTVGSGSSKKDVGYYKGIR